MAALRPKVEFMIPVQEEIFSLAHKYSPILHTTFSSLPIHAKISQAELCGLWPRERVFFLWDDNWSTQGVSLYLDLIISRF